jgi:hypothetical protein
MVQVLRYQVVPVFLFHVPPFAAVSDGVNGVTAGILTWEIPKYPYFPSTSRSRISAEMWKLVLRSRSTAFRRSSSPSSAPAASTPKVPGERNVPPLRLPPPAHLVNDDLIGPEFLGQQNRVALAGIKPGQICVSRPGW